MSRILKDSENQITYPYVKNKHEAVDVVKYNHQLASIIAHSDGVIIDVRSNYKKNDTKGNSYGNYIIIKHDNGMYTLYAHMKYGSVTFNKGNIVKKGDMIGMMGNTGHAIGSHLHFEVRDKDFNKIDPTIYIDSDLPIVNTVLQESDIVSEKHKEFIINLVKRTIRGDFGNGENRKKLLKDNYEEVQKQVNLNYKNNTTNWNSIRYYE